MKRLFALSLLVLLFAVPARGLPVTILYTNDLHLRFFRLDSLEELIEHERLASDCLLLLDAGDTWQDFRRPVYAVWGADEMVGWMNRVGYDAMALGNHDFYWGSERLVDLIERAEFPVLCANFGPVSGFAAPFTPSTVVHFEGLDVLIIGLVTSEYLPYSDYPWLHHLSPEEAVREVLAAHVGSADLVVALGHLPVADAVRIAAEVPGIDVFITGHSHEETPIPVRVGETIVVQSGEFGENLGKLVLDVSRSPREHELLSHELLATTKAPTVLSRGLRQLLVVGLALIVTGLFFLLP